MARSEAESSSSRGSEADRDVAQEASESYESVDFDRLSTLRKSIEVSHQAAGRRYLQRDFVRGNRFQKWFSERPIFFVVHTVAGARRKGDKITHFEELALEEALMSNTLNALNQFDVILVSQDKAPCKECRNMYTMFAVEIGVDLIVNFKEHYDEAVPSKYLYMQAEQQMDNLEVQFCQPRGIKKDEDEAI